jgi:hypothetical protein
MSPILSPEPQNKDIIRDWMEYYQYWSAAHAANAEDYKKYTDNELKQALAVCRRINALDNNSDESELKRHFQTLAHDIEMTLSA